jgi:hypothetical protein
VLGLSQARTIVARVAFMQLSERGDTEVPPSGCEVPRNIVVALRHPCAEVAGACRNRTYQPPCDGLSGFEDRAGHQTRTLPR